MTSRASSRGITLVLVSGLLALLAFLALAFGHRARIGGASTGARTAQCQARLAAESGMAYAEARLWRVARPEAASRWRMDNAGDDWTTRLDSPSLAVAGTENPSYAHGERWVDAGAGIRGVYEPGEFSPSGDRNGNGRFDACSGRLRGAADPFDNRFFLRITAPEGLACVNSGELGSPAGDHDRDGIPNAQESPADYRDDLDTDGNPDNGIQLNGIPDWRDPDYVGNLHLVNLLDNLGAVLENPLYPFQGIQVGDKPFASDDPAFPPPNLLGDIRVSDLGRIVVRNRPRGGYGSVGELAAFLPPGDFQRVKPFLTASGEIVPVAFTRRISENGMYGLNLYGANLAGPEARYEHHARVNLNAAPPEILKAILRYIASGTTSGGPSSVFVRLYPAGEADAIAEAIVVVRGAIGPIRTWKELLSLIHGLPASVFQDDPFTDPDDTTPALRSMKEELILAQLSADGYFPDPWFFTWGALDVDRTSSLSCKLLPRGIYKGSLEGPLSTGQYDFQGKLSDLQQIRNIPGRMTTECALGESAPGHFSVECGSVLGGGLSQVSATASGELSVVRETFLMTSQQDFEQFGSSSASPWRYAGGRVLCDGTVPAERDDIQSFPRFPLTTAFLPGQATYIPDSVKSPPPDGVISQHAYPRSSIGGLLLSTRQWQSGELNGPASPPCVFALPMNEDRPSFMGVSYDPVDYRDNLFDPASAARANPPSSQEWQDQLPDGTGLLGETYPAFHAGVVWAPQGPRVGMSCIEWPVFPLPRKGSVGIGTISSGVIEFSHPTLLGGVGGSFSGESAGPGFHYGDPGKITLSYETGLGTKLLVSVYCDPDGTVTVKDGRTPPKERNFKFPTTPQLPPSFPSLKRYSRHRVSIRFDGSNPDLTKAPDLMQTDVSVFYDGIKSHTSALTCIIVEPAISTRMTCKVSYPMDDVMLCASPHDADDKIAARAQKGAYAFDPVSASAKGTYLSPLFELAGDLRGGATPRGLCWDGFIPSGTGGKISLSVIGYDPAGNLLGQSTPVFWDGTVSPSADLDLGVSCRKFRIAVTLEAADSAADPWPRAGDPASGADAPVLIDTPILTECAIRWAGLRPRWEGAYR